MWVVYSGFPSFLFGSQDGHVPTTSAFGSKTDLKQHGCGRPRPDFEGALDVEGNLIRHAKLEPH